MINTDQTNMFLRELSDLMYDYDIEFDIDGGWLDEVPTFNISHNNKNVSVYGIASIDKSNITFKDIKDLIAKQKYEPAINDGKFSVAKLYKG